jgi:GT2 family glycosyltransferase
MVSVVLVTWNSAPWLPRCIEGLRSQDVETELIVVDNASSDESVSLVEPLAAHLIRNQTNRGFSAAVNQGIAVSRGPWILLLNPDCHLLPGYLSRLIASLDEAGDRFGAATGMLIRAHGDGIEPTEFIDSLGIRMTRSGRHLDLGQGSPVILSREPSRSVGETAKDPPRKHRRDPSPRSAPSALRRLRMTGDDWFEVFGVSGAAALYRRSFLEDVKIDGEIFDEDFFAYREDADLAWRGRLFGWRSLCDPRAQALHVRRVTPETRKDLAAEINMHSVKNRFLLRVKNEGGYLALRNLPFELMRDLLVIGAALTIERTSLPAFSWLRRNRARIRNKRREIQRRRVVSDRELARWFR